MNSQRTALQYRLSVGALVLAGIALLGVQASMMPGPTPERLQAQVETVASVQASIARAHRQVQYDAAENEARAFYVAHHCDEDLAEPTARHAVDHGLKVRLLSAVVFVESSCRVDAISVKGAVGLTQVNPYIWHVSREQLLDPEFNLNKGAEILVAYQKSYGVRNGLRHYLGVGTSDGNLDGDEYAAKVMAIAHVN